MFLFKVQGNPLFNRGFQEVFFDFLKSPLQRGFLCTLRGFFSGGGIAAANQWRLFREGILGEGIFRFDKTDFYALGSEIFLAWDLAKSQKPHFYAPRI